MPIFPWAVCLLLPWLGVLGVDTILMKVNLLANGTVFSSPRHGFFEFSTWIFHALG